MGRGWQLWLLDVGIAEGASGLLVSWELRWRVVMTKDGSKGHELGRKRASSDDGTVGREEQGVTRASK